MSLSVSGPRRSASASRRPGAVAAGTLLFLLLGASALAMSPFFQEEPPPPDAAFEWLGKAKSSGRVDMTRLDLDPGAEPLRGDPRYRQLSPSPADYADPFVEGATIIHERRGEAAGDQFGWIARCVGDVDGDGVADFTVSAPTHDGGGEDAGRVYVYSGRTGALLWTRTGEEGHQLGIGIEAAGDVNADGTLDVIAGDVDGDGHDDLVVGAWQHGSAAPSGGKVYLYSGRDGSLLRSWTGKVQGETFGFDATGLGDVDGDGIADLLLTSAWSAVNGGRTGRIFVISSGISRDAP